jgi:hypothetical protein
MKYANVGRNAPCPCGSGRKYKTCHARQVAERRSGKWIAIALGGVLLVGALVFINELVNRDPRQAGPPPGQVWSEEHGHYH